MKTNKGILIFNAAGFNLRLISSLLEAEDCTVYVTSLPFEALHILRSHDIDLILAPPHLDGMEGAEFKELAEKISPGVSIFLLPLSSPTADDSAENQAECHVNLKEFVQFIQNHIRIENHLVEQTKSFKEFFFTLTDRLLQIFEANDNYFFNNNHLVANLACKIAQRLQLEEPLLEAIHLAALLRDIGKIGIQNKLLIDKGRLGEEAFATIKNHPHNALTLLKQINFPWNVDSIIIHHHEHYDGNGYPDGIKGRNIPLGSRIIAAADAYVAMTTDRPHRKELAKESAILELMRMAGTQFDPEIVENLVAVINQENTAEKPRKKVLIIYNDESLAALLKLNLNIHDLQFFFYSCLDADIEKLAAQNFDLVIAEGATFPSNGLNFTAIFKRNDGEKPVPLIQLVAAEESSPTPDDPFLEWIPKPVDIDLLNTRIRTLMEKCEAKADIHYNSVIYKGVTGSLEEMGITDIIQVLSLGIKTAKVTISAEDNKGEIFVKNGKVVSVSTGELKGNAAFFEMSGWQKGVFNILHGKISDEENVTMDTMTLLLEAARTMDEKRYHIKL